MIETFVTYNFYSIILGFVLDLLFGDPNYSFHPIVLLGKLNRKLESLLYRNNLKMNGLILVVISNIIVLLITFELLYLCHLINPLLYFFVSTLITYQILAMRSLSNAAKKVYHQLLIGTIDDARSAVSHIVGRETSKLNKEQIVNACVESVAENTSDAVCAPLLYLFIGGPLGGMLYKNINTLDSMIGYRNIKYQEFGFFAAKIDDVFNYIPARISAVLMIASSFVLKLDYKNAFKIYKRDRKKHLSPNAGQLESVCAGALDIQLGGTHSYHNEIVVKDTIGDRLKKSENKDILKAESLMICCAWLLFVSYNIFNIIILLVRG